MCLALWSGVGMLPFWGSVVEDGEGEVEVEDVVWSLELV
jgi:hypothetical protein